MARLSQRVSAIWSTVKCPRCGAMVPVSKPPEPSAPEHQPRDEVTRWSFIWRVPRGAFCPDCDFPLSKYFGRLKWIRTLMVGLTIVLIALGFQVVGVMAQFGGDYFRVMRIAMRLGAAVFAVGAVGVVVGGKR